MNQLTRISITDGVFLDNALIKGTEISENCVEGAAYIDVLYGIATCDLPAVNMSLEHADEEYMLNVWVLCQVSESTFTCLAESTHNVDILKFTVDKNLYAKLAVFLQTTGSGFPLGGTATRQLTRTGVALTTKFFVDFYIDPAVNHSELFSRIQMSLSSEVLPHVVNDRLVGKLNDTTVCFKQIHSSIGNFSERLLSTFGLVLKPLLQTALDTALAWGFRCF